MAFNSKNVEQIYTELTFNFLNKDAVNVQKRLLLKSIKSPFFALDIISKYGSFNCCEIINFNTEKEMVNFKNSIEDETDDYKWSSSLFFSDGSKQFRYLNL